MHIVWNATKQKDAQWNLRFLSSFVTYLLVYFSSSSSSLPAAKSWAIA